MDNSIRLRLFQHTLTGTTTKWYIELPQAKYLDFKSLAFMFLQYFEIPVCCDDDVEIFLSCHQNTATHITNRIHEWQRRHNLCKKQLDDMIFLNWFLKILLPPISKDVTSERPQFGEEAILKTK